MSDGVTAQRGGEVSDHGGHELPQRRDGAAGLQDSGLDAAHVQQVLHQLGQTVGLDVDEAGEALASLRG